jgi:hypothetical protein
MAKNFNAGAWSKHFREQLSKFEARQDEFDEAITHLAIAYRPVPFGREPPYQPVEDPDKLRIRAFVNGIDRQVLARLRGEEVDLDWKVIWRRLCRDAIMNSDRERLNELLALYAVAQEAADERGI